MIEGFCSHENAVSRENVNLHTQKKKKTFYYLLDLMAITKSHIA